METDNPRLLLVPAKRVQPLVHPEGPRERPIVAQAHARHANVEDHDVTALVERHQVASQVPLLLLLLCHLLIAALEATRCEDGCQLRGRLGKAADAPGLPRAHQGPGSRSLGGLVRNMHVLTAVPSLAAACDKVPADAVIRCRLLIRSSRRVCACACCRVVHLLLLLGGLGLTGRSDGGPGASIGEGAGLQQRCWPRRRLHGPRGRRGRG
mmetsp:Transcript_29894/g.94235  ORF Transcript_29894/g.94235 Transcript_29894/m.94235 type:complete len:210 (-) Transcript_29894:183-812(-)